MANQRSYSEVNKPRRMREKIVMKYHSKIFKAAFYHPKEAKQR